jgi:hypothetical protein
MGFRFDRAGVRIPTLAVSAYIDPQTVITSEYRNISLIATLRTRWQLGPRSPPGRDRAEHHARSDPRHTSAAGRLA